VKKDDSQTELGKQIQTLTLNIETLMRAQAQVPITTSLFPTCHRCGIVHGLRECIIDGKLATTMDEINFVGEKQLLQSILQQFQSRTRLQAKSRDV